MEIGAYEQQVFESGTQRIRNQGTGNPGMQAVSCLALRTRRRKALCVIKNPRRGCPLAPITLEFADNREAAVARAEEGQGELANNHLSSHKIIW